MSSKKCQNSYCKNYTRKNMDSTKKTLTSTLKLFTKAIEKIEKKKNKTSLEIEKIKDAKKQKDNFIKRMREQLSNTNLKKTKKSLDKFCIKTYCNPDCKNTYFDESTLGLSKEILTKNKKDPIFLQRMRETKHKDIYQGRKHILKDSFYYDIDPKLVKQMKKEGAISGCARHFI